jgi:porphobilinogen synthase
MTTTGTARPPVPPAARRRISAAAEISVTPARLAQPIDVDLALPDGGRAASPGLPGWFSLGAAAALDRIRAGHRLGIAEFVLRVAAGADAPLGERVAAQAAAVRALAREAPAGVRLVVDPFAVALGADGSWGVRDAGGGIDAAGTYALIRDIAAAVAGAGADGIVTLGRLPREVSHTREGIRQAGTAGAGTLVHSFSQNSETSTAYVYLPPDHRDTGQKILPGNLREMTLWALLDAAQGTDVSVTKPLENFHVTLDLVRHADHPDLLDALLDAPETRALAAGAPDAAELFAGVLADRAALTARLAALRCYGYTVSGSTRALAHLAVADGLPLARARLAETWTNWLATTASRPGARVIDRNAMAYLEGGLLMP